MVMDIAKYAEGKTDHASGTMSWNAALNTTVYIFDLRKTNTPPQVTTTKAFYAMHQINAFEKVDATGNVQLVADVLAYPDASFMTANATFGSLSIFRDLHKLKDFYLHPSFTPSQPTRITIDVSSGRTSFEPKPIKDEKGTNLVCELPRINDRYRGKESCIFYATCGRTDSFLALVGKINLCTGKNDLLYTPAEYADEPVFVADPSGTAEDEGVILMTKLDGAKNKTFLHVVDAQSFVERARVYAPIHHTSGIHGAFFPDESHPPALIV
jgi:carotenoid cleavage dioxygenase-like enzyme